MTNRVHIDAPSGIIDIEGERDFVEGLLAKLLPILEKTRFGSRPTNNEPAKFKHSEDEPGNEDEVEDETSNERPKIKRKRSVAPKGHSCADRMLALKGEGFFKEKKGVSDIVAGLAGKGFTHKTNQVSAAGESLFKRGLLQRTKDGNGPFQYFWDRD